MKKPNLTSLNFIPSLEKGQWSVVFWMNGKYRERRFDNENVANKFRETWEEMYSNPQYSHREISEWVYMSLDPMYLRLDSNGEVREL